MRPYLKTALFLGSLTAVPGCGSGYSRVSDPVPIKGRVTRSDGKPVGGVVLKLQPMETGHMAGLKVRADGQFAGEAVPGRYAFYFSPEEAKSAAEKGRSVSAFQMVPEKYRSASLDHTVKVDSGELRIMLP